MKPTVAKPTAIDLFCGSGGVTLGLKDAGFQVVGAVDIDANACRTYRANHVEVRLIERDINDVAPAEFSTLLNKRLDLLVICAPCQPFSSQNRKRSSRDDRADLILAALPFVHELNPKLVFLENVPGLEHTRIFKKFRRELSVLGYGLSEPLRVDAADLGVPQRRHRMVMVAAKGASLNVALDIAVQARRTVKSTIGHLPPPPIGRSGEVSDPLHVARKHSELNLKRLRHIPADGGGRESLPKRLQLKCHKNRKASSFSDTYGRMWWNDVAPTLTTGCTDITRGRFAHPEQHRAITMREAARLQSFPDKYVFVGNASQIAAQIGNAVPPEMMKTIGAQLRIALSSSLEE